MVLLAVRLYREDERKATNTVKFRWTFESGLHSFEQDPSVEARPLEYHGQLRLPVSISVVMPNLLLQC